jgi:hypothetical protein
MTSISTDPIFQASPVVKSVPTETSRFLLSERMRLLAIKLAQKDCL